MNGKRRLLGSWVHGSMANAMLAGDRRPGRRARAAQVIALCGDGGFAMLMGDFLTLRQHRLPLKVVVFNNGTLGFVEMEMKAAGYLETGVALDNPDFAAMSRAAGIFAMRVEDPGELRGRRCASSWPSTARRCSMCVVARNELSMPPKIDGQQVKGFSLYVLRAVMSGRGDAVLDLAKTNLIR